MKKLIVVLAMLIFILSSSCSQYIGPPIAGANNIGYLPRPFITDSSKFQTYLSGEFSLSTSHDGHTEMNTGVFNISSAYANKNFNASIGAFGFIGNATYNDEYTDPNDTPTIEPLKIDFKNRFNGWGLRSTVGFQTLSTNKNINFRIINWENSYSLEYGEYAKFRTNISEDELPSEKSGIGNIYVSDFRKIFSTGFSSEMIWKNDETSVGIRAFVGFSPRLGKSFQTALSSKPYEDTIKSLITIGSLYYKRKNLFGTFQLGGGDKASSAKIGIGYTL